MMMPKEPRDGVYVWVSWLSKIMAGEISCEWQSWFKAHFKNYAKQPSDFDQPKWMQEHTDGIRSLTSRLRQEGKQVTLEGQNSFNYKTNNGITIAGKPDIIAIGDAGATVWDVKTGRQKASDAIQVMLYILMGPYSCKVLYGYTGAPITGAVYYPKENLEVPTPGVDAAFVERVKSFCVLFEQQDPPMRAPGNDCMWCDITKKDCSERVDSRRSHRHKQQGGLF
jgi:PD-(D/E)XK nuclease superfamily